MAANYKVQANPACATTSKNDGGVCIGMTPSTSAAMTVEAATCIRLA